ncbi:uncharacterized protein LOC117534405 isoform X1 [Gymnodraco acuticeps]|uniref:Uncharacterized protein LOC117534405 isoform X1 n=1 Tax=Gymnodraco acuticeps TaxID=8218 RepID=A0A6P8SUA0_GYMAC|nr:uncharacterized protein LOC117534405 isoform X1 [Gymnodraco acuticeps]
MNKAVVVFLKDQKYVTELKESGLMVNEEYIQVSPLATPSTRITVSGVPPFIPNEALERELKRFVPQQKPTLSVTSPGGEVLVGPDGPEVTWGQSVSISCSASTLPQQLFSKTTFILEKTSSSFRESRTAGSSSASFSIQEVNLEHEGWYRCQYQIRASRSPFSDSVRLSVSVPLQRPKLSVTSPSGGLFWSPEGAEVTRGHSFLLTCSIAPQYPGGLFSLLFSGSRLNVSRPAVNHSASFSFPAAGPEQQGSYSCLYEVTLSSSRTFTSTQEAPLTVIITFPVMVLVSSVCGGGLLLVLLVLGGVFFFFLIRRRRPVDLNQTPMSVTAINEYKEEEDEEEENVYMNVDDLVPQKKQKSGRAEEEDIDVYEQQESCADFREDEEDGEERESSDDEDDYVNVALSEQVVSGEDEDEDVYQNL